MSAAFSLPGERAGTDAAADASDAADASVHPDALSGAGGARRAALLLHAMGPKDRAWALTRLDANERAMVEPLLRELVELGIPPDLPAAALVPAKSARAAAMADRAGKAPAGRRRADGTAASDIGLEPALVVLAGSPPALAAALLACAAWPWRAAALARLDPAVREAWAQRAQRPLAPALASALREVFERHVHALPAVSASPDHLLARWRAAWSARCSASWSRWTATRMPAGARRTA